MTVRELISRLSACDDQDAEVIMHIVAEDDTFRPAADVAYGEMEPGGMWAHIHQRGTPNAVPCIVILPG